MSRMAAAGEIKRAHRGLYAHNGYSGPLLSDTMEPADGFAIKGTSTLYDAEGNERLTWVKSTLDADRQQALMKEVVQAYIDPLRGRAKATKTPNTEGPDYLSGFPIGDLHMGLYSYGEETGEDWDCDKAEATICGAMDSVIGATPATDECFVWQLGDFLHVDSAANTTAKGTPQDVDTRFARVVRVGIRTQRHLADRLLQKYKIVNWRNAKGNHDANAAIVLDEAMKAFYHNEPRLVVHDSLKEVFIHRWHDNLFASTHGHETKPNEIPGVMANDAGMDWGLAKHKFAHHGHFHQKQLKWFQSLGVSVECHSAPTAPDRWTVGQGYRSTREVKSIIYHKHEGEKGRRNESIMRI